MYLLFKSNKFKFPNDIIYSSQKINKFMSKFIINKIPFEKNKNNSTLILGLAFKQNCKDTRNSGVFDLIKNLNLKELIDVYDPLILHKPENKLKYNFLRRLIKNFKK